MMKYEAPEAVLILLQSEDILANSANPLVGKGDNTDTGNSSQFGEVDLW